MLFYLAKMKSLSNCFTVCGDSYHYLNSFIGNLDQHKNKFERQLRCVWVAALVNLFELNIVSNSFFC